MENVDQIPSSPSFPVPLAAGIFLLVSFASGYLGYYLGSVKSPPNVASETVIPTAPIPTATPSANIGDPLNCGGLQITDEGLVNPLFTLKLFHSGYDEYHLNWVSLTDKFYRCAIALRIDDPKLNQEIRIIWGHQTKEQFLEENIKYSEVYANNEVTINNGLQTVHKIFLKKTIPGAPVMSVKYLLGYVFSSPRGIVVMHIDANTLQEAKNTEHHFQNIAKLLTINQ